MIKRIGLAAAAATLALTATAVPAHASSGHAFRVEHQTIRHAVGVGGDVCATTARHRRVYDLPFGGELVGNWSPWHLRLVTLGPC